MSFTVKHAIRLILVLIVGAGVINFWLNLNDKNVEKSNDTANYIWNNQMVVKKNNVMFNAMEGISDVLMKPIEFGKKYGELPTATREGYLFDGWYTSPDGGDKVTADTIVTNDSLHFLYARYKEDPAFIARLEALEKQTQPVGFVFQSTSNINPSSSLGGSWKLIATGKVLVGYDASDDDFAKVGNTGGEKSHKLTIQELPSHSHTGNTEAYSGSHRHKINYTPTQGAEGYTVGGLAPGGWYVGEAHFGGNSYSNIPVFQSQMSRMNEGSDSGSHSHSFTTNESGGEESHNNLMPYYTVYTWEKTAM